MAMTAKALNPLLLILMLPGVVLGWFNLSPVQRSLCPWILDPCVCQGSNLTIHVQCENFTDINTVQEAFLNAENSSFESISIERANFTRLPSRIFSNASFRVISILHSELEQVETEAFSGSENSLEYLFLNNNNLQSFPFEILLDFPYLQFFAIALNNITNVSSTIRDLEELGILDFNSNSISSLQPGIFDNLPNLSDLNLQYNNLSFLPNETFSSIRSKQKITINLSYNNLIAIGADAFTDLNLTKLDLRHNSFEVLPEEVFYPLVNRSVRVLVEDNPINCSLSDNEWMFNLTAALKRKIVGTKCDQMKLTPVPSPSPSLPQNVTSTNSTIIDSKY